MTKKVSVSILVFLILGFILYQNGSIWLLKILSIRSHSSLGGTSSSNYSGPTPPYKDGSYTGSSENAFYGNIQVQAIISGGKITDVNFLQYPSDRSRSLAINTLAMPNLKQEAIQIQNANVDIVSGATDTSQAFVQSLQSALSQAK